MSAPRHHGGPQAARDVTQLSPPGVQVGFGLRGDVKELRAAHPALADCAAAVSPVLELRDSWERARAAGRGRPAKPHPTPSQPLALTPTFPLTLTVTLASSPNSDSSPNS